MPAGGPRPRKSDHLCHLIQDCIASGPSIYSHLVNIKKQLLCNESWTSGWFAPSHAQIQEMAALVSKDSGGPGIYWVHRFLKRHPEIHTKAWVKINAQRL